MKRTITLISVIAASLLTVLANSQVRIKDIAGIQGARGNHLMGYGLVIGLDGSGDSNSTLFTAQTVVNMLQKLGVNVPQGLIKVKNIAAVIVTAEMPAFAKPGGLIDVTVNSIGDAKSLQGGTLLQAPLKGADDEVYAVAQGSLSIGGFNFSAGGASAQKNHVTVGRVPRGARIEREVPTTVSDGQSLEIALNQPDFTTASRIADAINVKVPGADASALDPYSVRVTIPPASRGNLVKFIAQLESVSVKPDTSAKIVINERTGTLVVGGDVRISPCVVTHGNIRVKVDNTPIVAIPAPFSGDGKPVIVPQKDVTVQEDKNQLAAVPATTTIDQLVTALNALGATPRDLINILQAMKQAGSISAELELQ